MDPAKYQSILHSVNFTSPSWDAFIILVWVIVAVIYSFAAGRGRIIAILVAVYMSELIVIQAPFLSLAVAAKFGLAIYLARLCTFLVLFGFLFLVLSKYVFHTSVENRRWGSWFFNLIFAFLQVGFLISVILSFLPAQIKNNFTALVKFIFLTNTATFVWLLLPIVFLIIIGRHVSGHREWD